MIFYQSKSVSVSTAVNPSQSVGGVKTSVTTKLYPVLDEAKDVDFFVVVDDVILVVDDIKLV